MAIATDSEGQVHNAPQKVDECVREAAEIAPAYDVLLEAHGVPPG